MFVLIGISAAALFSAKKPRFANATAPPPFYTYPCACTASGSRCANTSSMYTVAVCLRGLSGDCSQPTATFNSTCVYENSIEHRLPNMTYMSAGQAVAFAGFAFDASLGPATVRVETSFVATACVVRPRSAAVPCTLRTDGRAATLTLAAPMLKLSVELYSAAVRNSAAYMSNALLVFADPPEDPATVPSPDDPSALIFGPGMHILSGQMPLTGSITQVYVAPGAYVIGGFITSYDFNTGVRITGRGVISGEDFPWHSPAFTWGLLNIDGGRNHVLDGLTLVDSPMFYIASVASGCTINNVKLAAAWTFNSDGLDVGPSSVVTDVFVRSNDDSLKLSGSGGTVRRAVVWQSINGAVVQAGWVNLQRTDILVDEVDVIHVDYCAGVAAGWCMGSDNEAVIDAAPDGVTAADTARVTITNVRVEGDAVRLLYLALPPGATGTFTGIDIVNVTADAQSLMDGTNSGVISGASASTRITDVTVTNMVIAGRCASSAAAAGVTVDATTTSGISFVCQP